MQLVRRTLEVMRLLVDHPNGLGVSAIAAGLDAAPSTAHRLLSVLVEQRFLIQDTSTKRYLLGPAVLPLARAFVEQNPLERVARGHLERVRDTTMESVFVARLVGDAVVCVASAVSSRPARFFMRVGELMPLHAAASARAILAFQPESEIDRLLDLHEPFKSLTESTPTSRSDILEALRVVRSRGYDISVGLVEDGVGAVAVPVATGESSVKASLALVAPENRISAELQAEYLEELTKAAGAIADDLGSAGELSDDLYERR